MLPDYLSPFVDLFLKTFSLIRGNVQDSLQLIIFDFLLPILEPPKFCQLDEHLLELKVYVKDYISIKVVYILFLYTYYFYPLK